MFGGAGSVFYLGEWGALFRAQSWVSEGVTLFELIMRTLNNTHPARLPESLWTSLLPG